MTRDKTKPEPPRQGKGERTKAAGKVSGRPSPSELTTLCDAAHVFGARPDRLFLEKHPKLFLEAVADKFAGPRHHELRMSLAGPSGKQIVDSFEHKLAGLVNRSLSCDKVVDIADETILTLGLEALGILSGHAHDWVKRRSREDYRRRHLAEFLDMRCKLEPSARVAFAQFHAVYLEWCAQNSQLMRGEEPLSRKGLSMEICRTGTVTPFRTTGGIHCLEGITLKTSDR